MKKKFIKKKTLGSDMVLQITSMADIFTILLVFLLKSFSTGASNITPASTLNLPETKKADPIADTLKVEISSKTILMDERPVMGLKQFQFEPLDLETDGTPRALNDALSRQRKKNTLQKYPQMLILADQSTPYSTLKRVLASASNSGFVDYKLVVVVDE
jgi:biopolymer transport protein ExbD